MPSKNIMVQVERSNATKSSLYIFNKRLRLVAFLRHSWQVRAFFRAMREAKPSSVPSNISANYRISSSDRFFLRLLVNTSVMVPRNIFERIGGHSC